jgi:hypothetical protein
MALFNFRAESFAYALASNAFTGLIPESPDKNDKLISPFNDRDRFKTEYPFGSR